MDERRVDGFCPVCQEDRLGAGRACAVCGETVVAKMDADGAMSRAFLLARGYCCGEKCRNCPYEPGKAAAK